MKNLNLLLIRSGFGKIQYKQCINFLLIAGFVFASLSSQAQGVPCYMDGYTNMGTNNGHTYFLSNFTEFGPDAIIAAAAIGGHLVTIADAAEDAFVASISNGQWAWIGLNDVAVEGSFVWVTGEPVTYTNWCPNEPNNCCIGEHWVTTNWCGLGWNDLYDGVYEGYSYSLPFVVEFDDAEICDNGNAVYCWFQDADGDGFGNPEVQQGACSQPEGYVLNNSDCNDGSDAVNPDGIEICNGIDDDCDGSADLANPHGDWTLQYPGSTPPVSYNAIAYIGDDKVLAFGGLLDGFVVSDGTWIYDLSDDTWTELNPPVRPSGRYDHAMAYIGSDKVLLYGGNEAGTDTWVFDLSDNTWTLMNPASNPSYRYLHAMATIGCDQVLLFGGIGFGGFEGTGTWVYDLSDDTWVQKSPATEPPFTFSHAMASIGSDKVLMLSAWPAFNETWVYDLSDDNWTLQNPGTIPPARAYHKMASLGGDRVLMFGGVDWVNLFYFGDTWVFDLSNNSWTSKTPSSTPAPSLLRNVACIGSGQALCVGVGGPDWSSYYFDTWLYTAQEELCNMPIEDLCSMPIVSVGADDHLYFGYGPGQCKTKTAVVTDGTAPFTYSWTLDRDLLLDVVNSSGDETMTGSNTESVTVCLLDTAELCVTVTDANGNTATDCAMMFGEDVRCFAGNNQKVNVCHNGNTICIDENALDAHLDHGDYVGICNQGLVIQDTGDGHDFDISDHVKPEFVIYPNPNNGDFKILFDHIGSGIINIIDRSGQVLKSMNVDERKQLDINLIESGIYFIQLITDEQMMTKKLTVVR